MAENFVPESDCYTHMLTLKQHQSVAGKKLQKPLSFFRRHDFSRIVQIWRLGVLDEINYGFQIHDFAFIWMLNIASLDVNAQGENRPARCQ
ncbi:MAG: hypothetical protein ABJN26_00005, partial [Stappiaceae bacterium]